jgi:hypothetical protein
VLHLLLVGWILFYSPVRVINLSPGGSGGRVSPARAQQIMEKVRERQGGTLMQSLQHLRDVQKQLAALETRKREEFKNYATELAKDAPAQIATAAEAVDRAQAEALANLEAAGKDFTEFAQRKENALYDAGVKSRKAANDQQAAAIRAQERLLEVLALGDERFGPAVAAQKEAVAAQRRAIKALTDAQTEAAREISKAADAKTTRDKDIARLTDALLRSKNDLTRAITDAENRAKTVATAEAAAAKAQAELAQVTAATTTQPGAESARIKTASNAVTKATKAVDTAKRQLAAAQSQADAASKRVTDAETKLDSLLSPATTEPGKTPGENSLLTLHDKVRDAQVEARAAQVQAQAAWTTAARSGPSTTSPPGAAALAELDRVSPPAPAFPPQGRPAGENDLGKIYEAAVQNEAALTEAYRRLRALELSMDRRVPLDQALELTDVTKVVRPQLKSQLDGSIAAGQDIPAAREAIQSARSEIGAMVQLAESLLSRAQATNQGASISVDEQLRRYERLQAMEALAAENEKQWATDLSMAMRNAGGDGTAGSGEPGQPGGRGAGGRGGTGNGGRGGAGSGGSGGGRGGVGGGSGSGGSGGAGGGSGGGGGGGGGGAGSGMGGAGGGSGGGSGGGTGIGAGAPLPGGGGLSGEAPDEAVLGAGPGKTELANAAAQPLRVGPGRTIAASGPSAEWIFIDSWYILGPFDNTDRANIDRKFPPETVVDLNAVYPGKNDIPIRWEFYQSPTADVVPPLDGWYSVLQKQLGLKGEINRTVLQYIIYYAYSELNFEQECDLWVAVGSDDFSKVWINDQLIWSSGKQSKKWRIDEGMRKVHFKKGVNRILYRIENGKDRTDFSFVIRMQPDGG